MPNFIYTAKDASGNSKVDRMEANSETDLAAKLKEQSLYLVNVQSLTPTIENHNGKKISLASLWNWRGVKRTEKMMAVRNLAVMIGAGLSLTRGLEALAEQASTKKFKQILLAMNDSVSKGVSFADSLSKYPREFNELFVSMVRVAEATGKLEETLIILYRQLKKEHDLISRVRGALVYPSVIVIAMLIIGVLMMIYVVPSLAETFSEMKVQLPASTRSIIWLAKNITKIWPLLLVGPVILFFAIRAIARTKKGKQIIDRLFLIFPLIGPIVKKVNSARFARTLSSLIESGLPIVRSLEITSNTVSNFYYKESVAEAAQIIQKGGQLSSVVRQYPKLYQPMVVQMIAVGEETGALASLLKRIALFFEAEVASITKNLSSVIEPILMLFIGAAVGFFAVSMLQPIYSLIGSV